MPARITHTYSIFIADFIKEYSDSFENFYFFLVLTVWQQVKVFINSTNTNGSKILEIARRTPIIPESAPSCV